MDSYKEIKERLQGKSYRWLVTGAAGFIGSNICHTLLDLGQNVIGLDNFATGLKENRVELDARKMKNWQFVEADICQPTSYLKAIANCDFVLHQAAIGSVPRSIKDPITSHTANVDGFIKILEAAKEANVKKFVFASSSSVYGDEPELPKVEGRVGNLLSPYAATKKINEIYASVFHKCYSLPTVGLRYFNVFGPRQNPAGPYAAVIPLWIKNTLESEAIQINGDGSYSRDFCYVENAVQANLLAALSSNLCDGQVYNIAFGQRTTLLQLAQIISEETKKTFPSLKLPKAVHEKFRAGDIPHSLANIEKAKKELGYDPKVNIELGLQKTIEYTIKQKERGL